ncbi:MAG: protein kinase, partial [Phycisphaerae bacterium]
MAEVLDLPVVERGHRIADLCGEDGELQKAVESLLVTADDSGAFATGGALRSLDRHLYSDRLSEDRTLPENIGPFEIVRELGRGGMGVVYEAWQQRPRRRVALKMLRTGLSGAHARARFEAEAEVLGRLCHPGIAQVYEAGVLEIDLDAQPYICMELVTGKRISDYVHEANLPLADRLDLIARVCDAIQHAHRAGVIHRDIKPANILVATHAVDENDVLAAAGRIPGAQPKVLDFGIARFSEGKREDGDESVHARLGGTVPYMAPEQLEFDAPLPNARTDVYALGVVMYELLTGRLPYDFSNGDIADAIHVVRNEDPTPATSLNRALRGDVSTIVATAIARDPASRYASPAALAADIRRFLEHRPIVARRPGTWYLVSKFARRNRALVGGVVATILCLTAGLVAASLQAVRAVRAEHVAIVHRDRAEQALRLSESQRQIADEQTRRAKAVAGFLTETFGTLNPNDLGRDRVFDDMLERASRRLKNSLDEDPLVRAELHRRVGELFAELGENAAASPHIVAAYRLYRAQLGDESRETLHAMISLAGSAIAAREVGLKPRDLLRDVLRVGEREFGRRDPLVLRALRLEENLVARGGNYDRALQLLEEYLAIAPDDPQFQLHYFQAKGGIHEVQLQFAAAIASYEQALAIAEVDREESSATVLHCRRQLAGAQWKSGQFWLAQKNLTEAIDIATRAYGPDRPITLELLFYLGRATTSLGDEETAQRYYLQALAGQEKVLGLGHPDTINTMRRLSWSALRSNDLATVEMLANRLASARDRSLGAEASPGRVTALVAHLALKRGDAKQAMAIIEEAIERTEKTIGSRHPRT